ncbi:ESX secretion-associated protein EspG [Nocardia sp. NBC_00416]|uniref:ESX secretion-associated protein EspG n=1 Tax=Nocardia sp. NBC_00416 TaxID=2975991 RepID=UPI002E216318
MRHTWAFSDLEFVVLWNQLREDFLPRPFVFTSRTPLYGDYLRERREALERLHDTMDPAFEGVLERVARPDIRLIARGLDRRAPGSPEGSIRLLAVRHGDYGYLLKQLPGETIDHSGGFTVTECDPLKLADAIAAELPEDRSGRRSHLALHPPIAVEAGVDHSFGRLSLWDSGDDPAESAVQFLQSAVARFGVIEIGQGTSRFGPRGRVIRRLGWRDLVDDGRYVITDENPPIATGVDSERLTAKINAEITEVVRAIRDERR